MTKTEGYKVLIDLIDKRLEEIDLGLEGAEFKFLCKYKQFLLTKIKQEGK